MKNTNRKTSKIKHIARVMLIAIILLSITITSCESLPQFFSHQTTMTTPKENNVHHEPEDLVNGMLAKMQAAGYEENKIEAHLYFDAPYLDWKYDYNVEILNGQIYLSGILYDEITYESDYELKYDDMMFVEGLFVEEEKYEILQQIQDHKKYYILKSTNSNRYGHQIAVYESGNTYYFLAFSESEVVIRIHKIIID